MRIQQTPATADRRTTRLRDEAPPVFVKRDPARGAVPGAAASADVLGLRPLPGAKGGTGGGGMRGLTSRAGALRAGGRAFVSPVEGRWSTSGAILDVLFVSG